MNPATKARFETWLRERKFAPSTITQSLIDFSTLSKKLEDATPLRRTFIRVVKRLAVFAEETGDVDAGTLAQTALARLAAEKPSRFGGRRARVRVSKQIDDASWEKLVAAIRAESGLPARVLEVMAETSLRVNDALQIRPFAVRRALELGAPLVIVTKGKKQRTIDLRGADAMWKRLLAEVGAWDYVAETTLAQLVSPRAKNTEYGPSAPYQKVRSTLQRICAEVGIAEKVWTHRLRHTVIANVYEATGDILLARDVAGQEDLKTTQIYTGRTKPERIAAALASVSVKTPLQKPGAKKA